MCIEMEQLFSERHHHCSVCMYPIIESDCTLLALTYRSHVIVVGEVNLYRRYTFDLCHHKAAERGARGGEAQLTEGVCENDLIY